MKYLHHVEKGVEFKEKMADIDRAVETEYDGSRTFKDIQILVIIYTRSYY